MFNFGNVDDYIILFIYYVYRAMQHRHELYYEMGRMTLVIGKVRVTMNANIEVSEPSKNNQFLGMVRTEKYKTHFMPNYCKYIAYHP